MKKQFIAMVLMSCAGIADAVADPDDVLMACNTENSLQAGQVRQPRYGVRLSAMPTVAGAPSYSGQLTYRNETALFTFWRANVDGKQRLFVQLKPLTASFTFCPGGNQFSIVQNGVNYGNAFRATQGDNVAVCGLVSTTQIFLVDQWDIHTNFNEAEAFTIYPGSKPDLKPADSSGSFTVAAYVSDCLLNWAESKYPALFNPATTNTQQALGYDYRYYSGSNTYLGIYQNREIHLLQANKSNTIVNVGSLATYKALSGC